MPPTFSTLDRWLEHIEKLHPKAIALGLERVQKVAERLGIFPFDCAVITVAGTNGKGSCVAFLAEILQAAGYKTGAYTSPHLHDFCERAQIDGKKIADEIWVQAFQTIEKFRQDTQLTYFEYTTLAALLIFKQAKLDIAILEVGLGGRLDAVNIIDADVAVITSIALDHQEWLGDNREAIGKEKAGIMRAGKPVVCGDLDPPQSIFTTAKEKNASLYCVKKDFDYSINRALSKPPLPAGRHPREGGDPERDSSKDWIPAFAGMTACGEGENFNENTWTWENNSTHYAHLPIPHLPLQNAATAFMALQLLPPAFKISLSAIQQGLQNARLPGRFQQLSGFRAPVILDVAHNPAAAIFLAERLQKNPIAGKTIAVVSILADKDIPETLRPLIPLIDTWIVAGLPVTRGATTAALANHLHNLGVTAYHTALSIPVAFVEALMLCQPEDRILVYGSFHTIAQVSALYGN